MISPSYMHHFVHICCVSFFRPAIGTNSNSWMAWHIHLICFDPWKVSAHSHMRLHARHEPLCGGVWQWILSIIPSTGTYLQLHSFVLRISFIILRFASPLQLCAYKCLLSIFDAFAALHLVFFYFISWCIYIIYIFWVHIRTASDDCNDHIIKWTIYFLHVYQCIQNLWLGPKHSSRSVSSGHEK